MVFIRNIAVSVLIAFICTACNEKIFTNEDDCLECYTIKPDSVDLVIDLSFNELYDTIPVSVYRDVVKEENFVYSLNEYQNPCYIYVEANRKYAVQAIYETTDKTVKVINSTHVKTKRVSETCEEDCWVITNEEIDLTLKF